MSTVVVAAMVLYPQPMFKRRERILIIGDDCLRTTIGKQSGAAS